MRSSLVRFALALSIVSVIVFHAHSAFAAALSLDTVYGTSVLTDYAWNSLYSNTDQQFPDAIPYYDNGIAMAPDSFSETWTFFTEDYLELWFDHEMDLQQDSTAYSVGEIYFTVDEVMDYVFEGTYVSMGIDDVHDARFFAQLSNAATDQVIFESDQISLGVEYEGFVLGQQDGNSFNSLIGSLTGTLSPTEVYKLSYASSIYLPLPGSWYSVDSDSFLKMSVTAIPEPNTDLLLASGLVVLVFRSRGRRVKGTRLG